MIKCVIFDFDGVIAKSVDVKTEAFRRLFCEYPQHLEAITRYHTSNGGISRFDKFRFIYGNILKEDLGEVKFKELCESFSGLVKEQVINADYVEGAGELLDKFLGRYRMFVVSGTPEKEMREIVRHKGLDKYFSQVYGSPAKKADLINGILRDNNYQPDEVIFIGDSVNDLNAAAEADVRFIARVDEPGAPWAAGVNPQERFRDMRGVFEYIEKINAGQEIDYEVLFKHVENLRIVLLVATSRSGSDFFQSLLDGHSQVLQVSGDWYLHLWWEEAKCKENPVDLVNEFIWHADSLSNHIAKFKSGYNKIERWDKLGEDKNSSFEVDINIFRKHMLNLLQARPLNSRNFFLAVNLAYGLASGNDIMKTKILFYHIHQVERIEAFKDDFADFDVICTTREPRNTLVSGMEHWKRYDSRTFEPKFLYLLLKRIIRESEALLAYTKNVKTLRLESLHLYPEEVLREFCHTYGLNFENSLLQPTYHGKKWWGDALSDKYLTGFNKNINEAKWKGKLSVYDAFLLRFILQKRLKHYGYTDAMIPVFFLPLALLLTFLPMKYEARILAYQLKSSNNLKAKLKVLLRSLIFYALRVCLYFRYLFRNNISRVFLPANFCADKAIGKIQDRGAKI